jgi:hypothetical protein
LELNKNGYQVTILTRDTTRLVDLPLVIRTQRVDYDSDFMLTRALHGPDALVSTVAMSAISNQPRLIDAAIAAGVKYFIPAEHTVNSRDAAAQAQPMMASVVAIQKYLATKEDQISWFVINCGALLEFVLDHPVILDFAQRSATLWDGGDGGISLSNIPLLVRTVSAVLRDPDRVANHRLKVHGGTISQNRALEIAKQASGGALNVEERDSQAAYSDSMASLNDGAALPPEQLMSAMLTAYNSAGFGKLCDGHFESAYTAPDNAWLGIDEFTSAEIEEAIRKKAAVTLSGAEAYSGKLESLGDVTGELAAIHQGKQ